MFFGERKITEKSALLIYMMRMLYMLIVHDFFSFKFVFIFWK